MVGNDFLHTAVGPGGYQGVQVGTAFLHLDQYVVHIVPGLDACRVNAQFVQNGLVHRKSGCTGAVCVVGNGVQDAVDGGTGADCLRLPLQDALAVLSQQVVQRRSITVGYQSLDAAGEAVDVEKVPCFAGSHGQVHFLRVEVTRHFDFHAKLFAGNLAGRFCDSVDLVGVGSGVGEAPHLQGDDFPVIALAFTVVVIPGI